MTTKEEHDLRRELAWADIEVRSVNVEKRTVDYVMSDDTVDSYGEIVEQIWRLDRFRKAPIILFAHNREKGSIPQHSFPIGRAIPSTVKVRARKDENGKRVGKELFGTVEFEPRELNELADDVFQQVAAGFMPCGSVGFYPHDVRRETRDDVDRYVLSDNELFEFSPCPIGANANAVANAMGSREERAAYLAARADEHDERAEWSTAFINKLPDAAFAFIKPGGEKDEDGKTVPRSLRMLPHHNASVKNATENKSVDLPHLRAALSRLPQSDMTSAQKSKAKSHLQAHADELLGDEKQLQRELFEDYQADSGPTSHEENNMDNEARVATLEAQLEAAKTNEKAARTEAEQATERATRAEQERDAAKAELATAQESITTLTTERDAERERANTLEGEAIELELQAQVGVKFHAGEIEFMRADRKREGKEEFAKRMAARPDLTTGKQKLAADTAPSTLPAPAAETTGEKTSAYLNQAS